MVKEREKESAPVEELRIEPAVSPPEFERAVSRACALVLRWEREGRPYRLLLGDRLLAGPADAGRRGKALAALALLPPGDPAPPAAGSPAPSRLRGTPRDNMPPAPPSRGAVPGSRDSA